MFMKGESDDPVTADCLDRYFDSQAWRDQAMTREALIERWHEQHETLTIKTLFLALADLHAETAGKSRFGEKSPHHCLHVDRIHRIHPGAKFIHIHRDPRDVIASRLSVPWTRSSHLYLAREWARIVTGQMAASQRLGPDVHMTLRYETLVADPEAEIRRLCAFLGETYEPDLLRFHERVQDGYAARERAWKGGTKQPLSDQSIGRYRKDLSARQIHGIERTIGAALLDATGYARCPEANAAGLWGRTLWSAADVMDRLGDAQHKVARSLRKRLGLPV